MLRLTLPQDYSPTARLSLRGTPDALLPDVYPGTPVLARPTQYDFPVSVADGEYEVTTFEPAGKFVIVKTGTSYKVADEWWELDSAHIGYGQWDLNVTVKNSINGLINGAIIGILKGGLVVAWVRTVSSGIGRLLLDSGAYTMNISAPGFDSVIGQAVTVAGNTNLEVILTQLPLAPPSLIQYCAITFKVVDGKGDAQQGVTVAMRPFTELDKSAERVISQQVVSGVTNNLGEVVLTVLQSASMTDGRYRLTLTDPGSSIVSVERTVRVPALSTCYANQLIDI